MTVVKRNNGFLATVHYKGKRWRRQFADHDEAKKWEARAIVNVLYGRSPEPATDSSEAPAPRPSTLREMADYVYEHGWVHQKAGGESYRVAKHVCEVMGPDRLLRHVDQADCDALIATLKDRGDSNATVNQKTTKLSKILSTAVDLGVIERKPKIRRLPVPKGRTRWYTDAELAKIQQFCKDQDIPHMGCFIGFLADTGLRVGEALKLKWSDFTEMEDGFVYVYVGDSKGGGSRSVPLSVDAFMACIAAAETNVDLQRETTGPFHWATKHNLRLLWNKIRTHMGWGNDRQCVLHTLRHTFCSRLVQKGVNILTVKELAGHKTIEQTLTYMHLPPDHKKRAIETLMGRPLAEDPEVAPASGCNYTPLTNT